VKGELLSSAFWRRRARRRAPRLTWRERLDGAIDATLLVAALAAIASLVAEYGFYLSASGRAAAHATQRAVLMLLVAQGAARLATATDRRAFLRAHRARALFLLVVLLHLVEPPLLRNLLVGFVPRRSLSVLASVYVIVTQLLVAVAVLPGLLVYSRRLTRSRVNPSLLILASFLVLVAAGTGLFLLPRATLAGIRPVDALFMATSAACVTGLTAVDPATTFTPLGRWVLLGLIQAGGLGIMFFTTFFSLFFARARSLRETASIQALLGEESLGRLKSTAAAVALTVMGVEALGAVALYVLLPGAAGPPGPGRAFFAAFHSVSAFCNAGFALWSENLAHPELRLHAPTLIVIMVLVTVGGVGFPVLVNLARFFRSRGRGLGARLSLHTRLVLITSPLLVAVGAAGLLVLERGPSFEGMAPGERVLTAIFHSVSARTAGFNTTDISGWGPAALFLICFLMWVGGSPASTAGGVKTTTLALALLNIRAIASGRNRVDLFRREVAPVAVDRAFSTVVLSLFVGSTALFVLLVTEEAGFQALLFEVVSALGTVGLSTGVTPSLTPAGKLVVTVLMLVGRVGLLGAVLALARTRRPQPYDYADEDVLVT